MINNVAVKVAASTLVVGVTMVGCKPSADMVRPLSASSKVPRAGDAAVKYYEEAQLHLQRRAFDQALIATEKAVELSPRDVGYRMLLADLYLKAGRFAAAETTFSDVLALNPGNVRAAMHLILTQIAQGNTASALSELERVPAEAAIADVGLAYALAGDPLRAIAMLEPAARAAEADARVRQNLALAYAIAGDWQKARVTAAQDVSPADLDARMEHWAAFVQPATSYDQVAGLLGVTPAIDNGQPARLALAPPAPVEPEASYAAAEVEAPAEMIDVRGSVVTIDLPPPVALAAAAPPAPAPAPVITAPAQSFAEVAGSLTAPQPGLIRASSVVSEVPLPAFAPAQPRSSKKVARDGRYVVQIGAFSTPTLVERAWNQAQKRYGFGSGSVPLSTTVKVGSKVTLHRLSVAGFASQPDAARFCNAIKVKRGVCFVRANAGDAPVQWASSAIARKA